MPHLVPEDGNPDQFLADEKSLYDDDRAVFFHPLHDEQGSIAASEACGFGSDGQRVDEGLRVVLPNICEEIVDVAANVGMWCLNASNNLRNDLQPGIDLHGRESGSHRVTDVFMVAIFEPQSKET